jgi:hypothetical protein
MTKRLGKTRAAEAAQVAYDIRAQWQAYEGLGLDIERDLPTQAVPPAWYRAFEAFYNGDKQPLIKLAWEQNDIITRCFADLLQRVAVTLKRPAHRPSIPAYKRSAAEARILWAKRIVKDCVMDGMLQSDAVRLIAPKFGLDTETLTNACLGKRASTRRFAKRIKK